MMRIDFLRDAAPRRRVCTGKQLHVIKLGPRPAAVVVREKISRRHSCGQCRRLGFPGSIIHKDQKIATRDLAEIALSGGERKAARAHCNEGTHANLRRANTAVARLTHARLFGSDSPYEERTTEELVAEMEQITAQHRDQDEQFLFNQRHTELQIVVNNHGSEPLQNVSLKMVMPSHPALFVAEQPAESSPWTMASCRERTSRTGRLPGCYGDERIGWHCRFALMTFRPVRTRRSLHYAFARSARTTLFERTPTRYSVRIVSATIYVHPPRESSGCTTAIESATAICPRSGCW